MSVCTGAFVLARAGLLDGREATTHPDGIEKLRRDATRTKVHANTCFVDNGKVITTAGASSGIDGALRVVQRLRGDDSARRTATYLEYERWSPEGGLVVSAQ
jgi:transcriptional regulator GlxA family with amidase domain